MILAVNIGNTNMAFATKKGTRISSCRIAIKKCKTLVRIERYINEFIKGQGILLQEVTGCIISSVVPEINETMLKAIRNCISTDPVLVTSGMDFDIDISSYDNSLIGTDRLLCCMASYARFQLPFIVYDLGTATTANVVDSCGVFLGGAILPGIDTGLKALTQNTSMLPEAVPALSVPLIGNNTNSCLLSGAIYGAAGFINNYSDRIEKDLGRRITVIITGGNAPRVLPFLKTDHIYCPDLLLEGLFLLCSKLNKEKDSIKNENQ